MINKTPAPLTMPARKIGIKSRSVTGIVPKLGHYESTLERDFMEIIRFEGGFTSFTPQPLKIEFRGKSREVEGYTPDGLIHFSEGSDARKPLLFEIKHREDFRKDWRKLIPKFRAAKKYCASVGWEFMVLTEKEIRTPYLTNIKFLWPYKNAALDQAVAEVIINKLDQLRRTTVSSLLESMAVDQNKRAHLIAPMWTLVAIGKIRCNLNAPLTMKSEIWLDGE
ncbi:heteromeric transposase endonuclease subunit TnsA [Pseudomonas fulva]|jgi:TnsA endonuclease N terminal/TnsA endonuclease C terminal|uniref:TnsA endonuclease N-terminal domain-containing protein n=1 Tax=Pseudomonas TaxID=286 RepID=UPI0018D85F86|nr:MULTISPECIES: TnsA endonuclease N-terminal domain-containing protein [Pseudomonas]MCY4123737.1 TnsA endonuclease N-terminal domain-containing protein [Pseudomonas sp.]MBH3362336.1 heteromeric transposase endonuclease subunit TnsA [Pseudomonas sp. URMO17WK12:I11]MBN6788959.1 heteromeric transposase endonuclease subunit TnsA [Pseudomonas fulva]MBN6793583.1 heteromeric transposase endonuclease subunit TnsA [Pseudomonas fulva]MBN6854589.1 heteromeric transposase endonuclease subunit TnsA [Pseud